MSLQSLLSNKIIGLVFFTTLISCVSSPLPKIDFSLTLPHTLNIEKVLDGKSTAEPPTLSQIVDSIEYVKLGMINGKPIGRIHNVKVTKEHIFLTSPNEGALMFRRNGEFVRQLGKLGKGPGEYAMALNVTPIERNDLIAVQAYPLGDYPIYNLSGEMVKRLARLSGGGNTPYSIDGGLIEGEDVGFYNRKNGFMFILRNLDGDTVFFKQSHHEAFLNTDSWKQLQYYIGTWIVPYKADTLLVYENAVDTIFSFNGKEHAPRYILDIGKYNGTLADRLTLPTKEIAEASTQYISFFETHSHLFLQMLVRNKPWLVWLDKSTGQINGKQYPVEFWTGSTLGVARSDRTVLPNDYDGGPDFWPQTTMSSRLGVAWYYAHELMELESPRSREATNKDAQNRLASLVGNLTIEDNPVVMIVHYKGENK